MKKILPVTHKQLFEHMAKRIGERKRVVLAIGGTKKELGFSYTVGNQEKQLPELLIIGNFKSDDMCILLNRLSDAMLEAGEAAQDGAEISMGGKYPLLIYSASDAVKATHTVQAGQFYDNEDYKVMQVVLPDLKGCYPPDPKCHKAFQVPVFRGDKSGQAKANSQGTDQGTHSQGTDQGSQRKR